MTVWDVPGQEHAVEVLRQAVERDEVSHAWAFIGPAGVGQAGFPPLPHKLITMPPLTNSRATWIWASRTMPPSRGL